MLTLSRLKLIIIIIQVLIVNDAKYFESTLGECLKGQIVIAKPLYYILAKFVV